MSTEKIFEVATRSKMRFPYKGMISVEDLWDLPLTALDSVFKNLNKQVKEVKEESLLSTKSKEDETLSVQVEIVKYIVSVKLAEADSREKASEKKERNQKIMSIISSKKDEALNNMSVADLEKLLAE